MVKSEISFKSWNLEVDFDLKMKTKPKREGEKRRRRNQLITPEFGAKRQDFEDKSSSKMDPISIYIPLEGQIMNCSPDTDK